jgi:biotin transport system substrate-specific component
MQLFGVFCSLYLLGGKKGTLSILLYIFIGAVGLPVFSGFRGGIGSLFDATGGFITGFLFSGLAFLATSNILKNKKYAKEISLFSALIVCYLCGAGYFALFYSRGDFLKSFGSAVVTCILPFIIPDLLKLLLAITVCRKIEKHKIF